MCPVGVFAYSLHITCLSVLCQDLFSIHKITGKHGVYKTDSTDKHFPEIQLLSFLTLSLAFSLSYTFVPSVDPCSSVSLFLSKISLFSDSVPQLL